MEKKPIHSAARCGSRGFTLVELAMIVAIGAIVYAVAVPRFSYAVTRYKLESAARRLTGDIEFAQQQAIATSSSRTLTFNFTGKSYKVTSGTTGTVLVIPQVELDEAPYFITSVTATIAGSASTPIKFDGYGKPNGAGTIVLKIKNDKKTITIDAATGKTKVS